MCKTRFMVLAILASLAACNSSPRRPSILGSQSTAVPEDEDQEGVVIGTDGKPIVATGNSSIYLSKQEPATGFPRLSHAQWENAVKDLLQLSKAPDLAKNFPNDPESLYGNRGDLFQVSPDHWRAYRDAAESVGEMVGKDANLYKKLIPAGANNTKAIVSSFLRKALRRPATDSEINSVSALFSNASKLTGITDAQGAGFAAMIAYALQTPDFLYHIELGDKTSGRYVKLSAHELASRLSFAVWNTIPDQTLNDLADSGEILDLEVLKEQAKRLVNDPRGLATLKNLHIKGYKIDKFAPVAVDKAKFPETAQFDSATLFNEASLFVEDVVVKQGKGVTELFTVPYAFVSGKTAAAYDVSVSGNEPKKTNLDPAQRAGLLSQVAFLSYYAKSAGKPAIIKRGHYVAEDVLCQTFKGAPPPPAEDFSNKEFKTDRERVHALSGVAGCGGCHNTKINPPGFALDHFGPGGKWRMTEPNGNAIDATGTFDFSDGKIEFDGPVELMKKIVERPELHECYAQKMLEGLYARFANTGDSKLIEKLGKASQQEMSPKDVFIALLSDPLFTMRTAQ